MIQVSGGSDVPAAFLLLGLQMTVKQNENLAPLRADEIYPLSIFMQKTGLGSKAMRMARKAGLVVRRVSTRSYVKGADFSQWLDSQPSIAG
jgi:hypothetical protein